MLLPLQGCAESTILALILQFYVDGFLAKPATTAFNLQLFSMNVLHKQSCLLFIVVTVLALAGSCSFSADADCVSDLFRQQRRLPPVRFRQTGRIGVQVRARSVWETVGLVKYG